MNKQKWQRRDKKQRKRKYGHREDGRSVFLSWLQTLKRNRYWKAGTLEGDDEQERA